MSPADYISLWPLTKRNGTDIKFCSTASKLFCLTGIGGGLIPLLLSFFLLGCPQTPPSKGEVSHSHSDVFLCAWSLCYDQLHTLKR